MSTLAEQLRGVLGKMTPGEYRPAMVKTPFGQEVCIKDSDLKDIFANDRETYNAQGLWFIHWKLPQLLDEHERLERESEAGKELAERIRTMKPNAEDLFMEYQMRDALSLYRTACDW